MLVIYSKNIVLSDKVIEGYIKIKNDKIESVTSSIADSEMQNVINAEVDYVMPGFINLGSCIFNDFVNKNTTREEAQRAIRPVIYGYTVNGVTKVYHIIKCQNFEDEKQLEKTLRFIKKYTPITPLENLVHLKFQIKTEQTTDAIKKLLDDEMVDFLSYDYMRDYKDANMYKNYYALTYLEDNLKLPQEISNRVINRLEELREEVNIDELAYIIKYAHYKGVKVSTSRYKSGMHIKEEFKDSPDMLNITDDKICLRDYKDIYKLVSSTALIEDIDKNTGASMLDDEKVIVSSFTNPCDHLHYLETAERKIGLPRAVATVSKNPADALEIENYGEIKKGNIADICIFKKLNGRYCLNKMIKNGKIKLSIDV